MKQIEKVYEILGKMQEIGGIPNNAEFYAEFDSVVKCALGIPHECKWKATDLGMFGFNDYVFKTQCGAEYDRDKTTLSEFCPNCGNKLVLTL